jgi:hypothetical protein
VQTAAGRNASRGFDGTQNMTMKARGQSSLFAVECQLHRVTLPLQGTLQEPSHSRFVLGYQDPHTTMLSELDEFIVTPRLHHRLLLSWWCQLHSFAGAAGLRRYTLKCTATQMRQYQPPRCLLPTCMKQSFAWPIPNHILSNSKSSPPLFTKLLQVCHHLTNARSYDYHRCHSRRTYGKVAGRE